MKNNGMKWTWIGLVCLLAVALVGLAAGCDIFTSSDASDGQLTVSIAEYTEICDEDPDYFYVWVMVSGSDPNTAAGLLGVNYAEIIDGKATVTVHVWDETLDGPTAEIWKGTGGNQYDVYPTVYCKLYNETSNPDPVAVYGAANYSKPITYTQDGTNNKTISTTYSATTYEARK
ncbi:MAG: hypothetical protein WCY01_11455 [Alkalispirochaeta sp.]